MIKLNYLPHCIQVHSSIITSTVAQLSLTNTRGITTNGKIFKRSRD